MRDRKDFGGNGVYCLIEKREASVGHHVCVYLLPCLHLLPLPLLCLFVKVRLGSILPHRTNLRRRSFHPCDLLFCTSARRLFACGLRGVGPRAFVPTRGRLVLVFDSRGVIDGVCRWLRWLVGRSRGLVGRNLERGRRRGLRV